MKKILLALPVLLLSACATTDNAISTTSGTNNVFKCSDNSQVIASYSKNGDIAYLNVNMPKIKLSNQALTLNQAVSGSGARYINTSNPDVSYEWHTKANEGIISVTWSNGPEYSVSCVR